MKIIRNKVIPFPGYKAINLFGLLFVKQNAILKEKDINHEAIHTEQMKETLFIFFYIWYVLEFLFKWIFYYSFEWKRAYHNISFEREAFENQDNLDYLKNRKHYAWI